MITSDEENGNKHIFIRFGVKKEKKERKNNTHPTEAAEKVNMSTD